LKTNFVGLGLFSGSFFVDEQPTKNRNIKM